jgi:hypothetical protein
MYPFLQPCSHVLPPPPTAPLSWRKQWRGEGLIVCLCFGVVGLVLASLRLRDRPCTLPPTPAPLRPLPHTPVLADYQFVTPDAFYQATGFDLTSYLSAYAPNVTEVAAAFMDYTAATLATLSFPPDVPTVQAYLMW